MPTFVQDAPAPAPPGCVAGKGMAQRRKVATGWQKRAEDENGGYTYTTFWISDNAMRRSAMRLGRARRSGRKKASG